MSEKEQSHVGIVIDDGLQAEYEDYMPVSVVDHRGRDLLHTFRKDEDEETEAEAQRNGATVRR